MFIADIPQAIIEVGDMIDDVYKVQQGDNITLSCKSINTKLNVSLSLIVQSTKDTTVVRRNSNDVERVHETVDENVTVTCILSDSNTGYETNTTIEIVIVTPTTDYQLVTKSTKGIHITFIMLHSSADEIKPLLQILIPRQT